VEAEVEEVEVTVEELVAMVEVEREVEEEEETLSIVEQSTLLFGQLSIAKAQRINAKQFMCPSVAHFIATSARMFLAKCAKQSLSVNALR